MVADFAAWASYAGDGEFWVITGLLAAAAFAAFVFSFHFLRRARLLEDVPTSRIRSAAQGYCELDGIARLLDGPAIAGPLTGLPCVWWEYHIEEKVTTGSGKNRMSHWRTLERRASEGLFLLDDDTGVCVIDPDHASVITDIVDRWHGAQPRWVGPPPAAGWRRWFGGRYRFTERRLAIGRPLFALGWFRTESGAAGGVHVLGAPPRHHDRPFLLSALPQRELTRRFRVSATACLVAFFAAGGGAVFLIGARFD